MSKSKTLLHLMVIASTGMLALPGSAIERRILQNVRDPFVHAEDKLDLIKNGKFEEIRAARTQCVTFSNAQAQPWQGSLGNVAICNQNKIWSAPHQQQSLTIRMEEEIYQDIKTIPGTWLKWEASLAAWGVTPSQVNVVISGIDGRNKATYAQGKLTRRNWTEATGDYRVPPGQTVTRIKLSRVGVSGAPESVRVDSISVRQNTLTNTCGQHVNIFPYDSNDNPLPRRLQTIEDMSLDAPLPPGGANQADVRGKFGGYRDTPYMLSAYLEKEPGNVSPATINKISDFVVSWMVPATSSVMHDNPFLFTLAGWTQFYAEYGCYLRPDAQQSLIKFINNNWDSNRGWTTSNFRTLRHAPRVVAKNLVEARSDSPTIASYFGKTNVEEGIYGTQGIIDKNRLVMAHDEWSSMEYGTQNFAPLYMLARFVRDPDQAKAAYASMQDSLQRYAGHWFNGWKMSFSPRDGAPMQNERNSTGGIVWMHMGGEFAPGPRVTPKYTRNWMGDAVAMSQKMAVSPALIELVGYNKTKNVDVYSRTALSYQHAAMRRNWGMFSNEATERNAEQTTPQQIVWFNQDGSPGNITIGDWDYGNRDVHLYDDSMGIIIKANAKTSIRFSENGVFDLSCAGEDRTATCNTDNYVAYWTSNDQQLFMELRSTKRLNKQKTANALWTSPEENAVRIEVAHAKDLAGSDKFMEFKQSLRNRSIKLDHTTIQLDAKTTTELPVLSYTTRAGNSVSFTRYSNLTQYSDSRLRGKVIPTSRTDFPFFSAFEKVQGQEKLIAYQKDRYTPFYVRHNDKEGSYIVADKVFGSSPAYLPPDAKEIFGVDGNPEVQR